MQLTQRLRVLTAATALVANLIALAPGQLVLSGNENKIQLTSGVPRLVDDPRPDSLSLIDLSVFPPRIRHVEGIANTVLGPPSNIAITRDGHFALLANSVRINRQASPDPWEPTREVHLLDLRAEPPAIVSTVQAGLQPSGISLSPDGQFALVANRAEGSVTAIGLHEGRLQVNQTVAIGPPTLNVSDVAIHPNGRLALASVQKGGYLAVLHLDDGQIRLDDNKPSVYGQPYRVVITPDGRFGVTAGQGFGANGVDADALSVVDLAAEPIRTVDVVAIGAVPESIEVSPDGRWVAAVLMAGSNFPSDDPRHRDHGELVMLRREEQTFRVVQRHPVGRIPEGVAFTADDQYLLVQCHPDRAIWVFRVGSMGVEDTGHRIAMPGMPSSLRAAP
jgi:DNA-binding beta-propeller fold protein YncE